MNIYRQPIAALVRFYRWIRNRCLVCGGKITGQSYWNSFLLVYINGQPRPHYRYCQCECAMYDGVMSVRTNPNPPLKKSRILTGENTFKCRKIDPDEPRGN